MTPKTVAIGAVLLVALAGSALAEERVLYCTETGSAGFRIEVGQTEGKPVEFHLERYVVKVTWTETQFVREEKRIITPTISTSFSCRRPEAILRPEFVMCTGSAGLSSWVFNGNNFFRSSMWGAHPGPFGRDIAVSYGTCTGF